MIVKLSQGNSVSGMVNYHFDKGKEVNKILFLNHLPSEPKAMIAKLQEQNALNTHKSTKTKNYHFSINFNKKDHPSDALLKEIALEYMIAMGFEKGHPFAVLKHEDREKI